MRAYRGAIEKSFRSPAREDMKEPINLGDWLVEHPGSKLRDAGGGLF
jgi:hypothetical protein